MGEEQGQYQPIEEDYVLEDSIEAFKGRGI